MAGAGCGQHRNYTAGCTGCQKTGRHYDRRRSQAIANGTWQPRIPGHTIAEHLKNLREAGMSVAGIARDAQLPYPTVYAATQRQWVEGATGTAILAVQPRPSLPAGMTEAWPATRRIRSLVAIGHSLRHLAERMDRAYPRVWEIAHSRRPVVTENTLKVVDALFQELSGTPGISDRARRTARRNNWMPPLAWNDIDDPDEQASIGQSKQCRRGHPYDVFNTIWDAPPKQTSCRACADVEGVAS